MPIMVYFRIGWMAQPVKLFPLAEKMMAAIWWKLLICLQGFFVRGNILIRQQPQRRGTAQPHYLALE